MKLSLSSGVLGTGDELVDTGADVDIDVDGLEGIVGGCVGLVADEEPPDGVVLFGLSHSGCNQNIMFIIIYELTFTKL